MKKFILLSATFLLTGCPGPMDPVTRELPAQAAIVNNQVCITAPASKGEKIFSVQFGSDSGQEIYKTFSHPDEQIQAVSCECLPTFGFDFKAGDSYSAFYRLEKNSAQAGRLFAVRFSLTIDGNGRLRLTQYQR